MSVLQEILEKGYVDPEVLKQLGEEQKQILFIKMREEQLRKWRLWEAEMDNQENGKTMEHPKFMKNGSRRVQWLTGRDGNVWVWVMGEHPNDISIEQIIDMESKEKARRIAEKEIMQTLRKAEDLPNALDQHKRLRDDEERALKDELARVELNVQQLNGGRNTNFNGSSNFPAEKANSHSPYDELDGNNMMGNMPSSANPKISNHQPKLLPQKADELLFPFRRQLGSPLKYQNDLNGRSPPPPLPFAPQEIYDNLNNLPPPPPIPSTSTPPFMRQFPSKAKPSTSSFNGINGGSPSADLDRTKPPPVPEKPPGLRRTVSNNLTNGLPGIEQIAFNTIRSYIPPEEVQKRQSRIFEQLKEEREQLEREADAEARRQEEEYEERERKAKEADESIRKMVQRAREQHRKNLRTSDALLPLFNQPNGIESVRDALRALPRPPKPKSRQAIIQWFRQSEMAQWNGWEQRKLPKWFHGIISRDEADRLLRSKSIGSYLVRITERIFGYTVSYRAEEGTKNFLVERIADGYQFMGTNQLVHSTLIELIAHHHMHPITVKGGEILREAVGQEGGGAHFMPDYLELFPNTMDIEERRN